MCCPPGYRQPDRSRSWFLHINHADRRATGCCVRASGQRHLALLLDLIEAAWVVTRFEARRLARSFAGPRCYRPSLARTRVPHDSSEARPEGRRSRHPRRRPDEAQRCPGRRLRRGTRHCPSPRHRACRPGTCTGYGPRQRRALPVRSEHNDWPPRFDGGELVDRSLDVLDLHILVQALVHDRHRLVVRHVGVRLYARVVVEEIRWCRTPGLAVLEHEHPRDFPV